MGAGLLLPAKRKPPSYLTTTRLSSHAACVTCILLSGDRAFTASRDRVILMWRLSQAQAAPGVARRAGTGTVAEAGTALALNTPLKVFEGHSHWVTELVLEKSGCLLYSGGMDKTVRVWDVANAACLYVYCGHTDWLSGLALVFSSPSDAHAAASAASPFRSPPAAGDAPAPDYIMSGSHDGSLRLWQPYRPSLRTRSEEACVATIVLPGGGSIIFVAACALGVACASNYGSVAFLPTHDPHNMLLHSVRAHNGPITAMSAVHWLPGASLPSGRLNYNSGGAEGKQPRSDPSTPKPSSSAAAPAGDVPVCFSGGADGCVRMWGLQPLRCLHKYEVGTGSGVCCLAFHRTLHLLTVTYDKGETVGWIDQTRVPLSVQLVGSVRGVVHAGHGGVVAAASSGVTIYHPTKGARLLQLSGQRCSCLVYCEEPGVTGGRLAFAEEADVVVCSGDVLQEAPCDVAVKIGR
jgi:WD40 repeat protein